jgi:hypothetical protein
MESQLNALELRMQRREGELMTAIEETKAAAAMERTRLAAIHSQVRCRCATASSVYTAFNLPFFPSMYTACIVPLGTAPVVLIFFIAVDRYN